MLVVLDGVGARGSGRGHPWADGGPARFVIGSKGDLPAVWTDEDIDCVCSTRGEPGIEALRRSWRRGSKGVWPATPRRAASWPPCGSRSAWKRSSESGGGDLGTRAPDAIGGRVDRFPSGASRSGRNDGRPGGRRDPRSDLRDVLCWEMRCAERRARQSALDHLAYTARVLSGRSARRRRPGRVLPVSRSVVLLWNEPRTSPGFEITVPRSCGDCFEDSSPVSCLLLPAGPLRVVDIGAGAGIPGNAAANRRLGDCGHPHRVQAQAGVVPEDAAA